MKNICFYTSDYGYGHASRDIALIRGISGESDARIFVKTEGPLDFMRRSLPSATFIQKRNDIGVSFKGKKVIADETERILDRWVDSWDEYIEEERKFCQAYEIDLIISDIVPQPFIVASDLGLPSIGISNFTWHYIFYSLFGRTASTEKLEEAYKSGDIVLVLPFNEEMDLFKRRREISLVSRRISDRTLRRVHDIKDTDLLVYLGIGRSLDPATFRRLKDIDLSGVTLLVSSGAELESANVIKIPEGATESQNYIAMCDLVVSKAGYGTASEALRAEVPMLLFRREGYEEDKLIVKVVEDQGIGKEISERSFFAGDWVCEIEELERYREGFEALDERLLRDGIPEAVEVVLEMIN